MNSRKTRLTAPAGVAVALAVALLLLIPGCSKKSANSGGNGPTALDNLPVAKSALSTTAPDAKLLIVQTAQSVTPTDTPVWAYLFGSPSSGKTYGVYVREGLSMGAQEFGSASLTATEWAKVPDTTTWKVDSDEAYTKALAVSGAKGTPSAYLMGMLLYKTAEDTSTIKPLVWQVVFNPGSSGATTATIEVDANTGAAAVSKTSP